MVKEATGFALKGILKQNWPLANFSIRKSRGSAWNVKTDLIINPFHAIPNIYELRDKMNNEGLDGKNWDDYKKFNALTKRNNEVESEIKALLRDYYHVDFCEFSGEILGGGNTFLFVSELKESG